MSLNKSLRSAYRQEIPRLLISERRATCLHNNSCQTPFLVFEAYETIQWLIYQNHIDLTTNQLMVYLQYKNLSVKEMLI